MEVESRNCGWMKSISAPYPEGERPRKQKIDVKFDNGDARKGVPFQNFLLGAVQDNTIWNEQMVYNKIFKTGRSGDVEVVFVKNMRNITVKFLETGNEQVVPFDPLIKGQICDLKEREDRFAREEIEKQERAALLSKRREEIVVEEAEKKLRAEERKRLVEENKAERAERKKKQQEELLHREAEYAENLLRATTVSEVSLDQSKKLKDVLDFDFKDRDGLWVLRFKYNGTFVQTRLGKLHNNMTQRCKEGGSAQNKSSVYVGVTISDEFKDAQAFCEWAIAQKGWGLGWNLDKDLLGKSKREYSASTCCFLPQIINSAIIRLRNDYDKSTVVKKLSNGMYRVKAQISNGKVFLGDYTTFEEGFGVYKEYRERYVRKLAEEYKEGLSEDAYNALMNWRMEQ